MANQGGNVSAYTINATNGALTQVAGSPFPAGSLPFYVVVDPMGRFVYVANADSNNVSAYTINASTGALTPVAGSPFGAGTEPLGVAIDPRGEFAYVTNAGDHYRRRGNAADVSAYTINASTGALTPVAGSPFGAQKDLIGAAVAPTGKFLYVTDPTEVRFPHIRSTQPTARSRG